MRKALPDQLFTNPENSRLTMLRTWVLDNQVTEIEMPGGGTLFGQLVNQFLVDPLGALKVAEVGMRLVEESCPICHPHHGKEH